MELNSPSQLAAETSVHSVTKAVVGSFLSALSLTTQMNTIANVPQHFLSFQQQELFRQLQQKSKARLHATAKTELTTTPVSTAKNKQLQGKHSAPCKR